MKDTRRFFPLFKFYAKEQIEKYLEKKAAEGWFLEKMEGLGWKFRKGEPKKLTYSVNYFAKASAYDPAPSADQEAYYELCSYAGWNLAASNAQMQVFCTELEDVTPIETDAVLEIQSIHKSVKKSFYPVWILWIILGFFQLGMALLKLFISPIAVLSSNIELGTFVFYPFLTAFYIKELVTYLIWHKKARRDAETFGSYSSIKGTNTASVIVVLIFAFFYFTVMLSSMYNTSLAITVMISTFLEIALLTAINLGIHKLLKKLKASAKLNLILTICTAAVSSMFLTVLTIVFVALLTLSTDSIHKNTPEPPLSAQDLITVDSEKQESEAFFDESFFVSQYDYNETSASSSSDLSYMIVTAKAEALYDVCLKELLDDINLFGYTGEHYENTDAKAFLADEAYVLYDGDTQKNKYILCYDNKIVEISFGWQVTEEQMSAIGEAFN